ncbi:MAG TPA: translocation/assembly module TamB domain-containing protein, partial [Candidatus Polarisedimenticolia bacterium]|nr:translocation/assembly module TamB domain-containing protein [Candidatus Polarisedimenticolia bacterium]
VAAQTASPSTNLPPLHLELHIAGNTNAAQLSVAKISSPALQAELSAPVALSFHPPYLSQPATLNLAADLDQQHWFVGQGKMTGQAVVSPDGKFPRVSFTLSGRGISTTSLTSSNLAVEGELTWPVLDLKTARIEMADASTISVSGKYDLAQKIVSDGHLTSSGSFGGQFLPAGYSFHSASVDAQFAGPLTSITNSAQAQVKGLTAPHMSPVDADVSWSGAGTHFDAMQIALKAGQSSLTLRGSAQFGTGEKNLTLTAFELTQSNQPALRLEQPAQIALTENRQTTNWDLNIATMSLTGDGRAFRLAGDVSWPHHGTIQAEAHGLDARLLHDFIPQANTRAVLNELHFAGGWTNGPVAFQLTSDAEVETKENFPFSANAKLSGGKDGISIEQLSVSSATQIVCRAEGSLPISFDPARKDGMMQIDTEAPLKLHAFTDPKSVLWEKIAEATGLRLREPKLSADLEGTWAAPKGRATLQVQRIDLSGLERPIPGIDNVDLLAVMDRATARVTRFHFEVEKQPVDITAQIPLGESFWAGLRHKQHLPDWRQASARLVITNAQLAPFASLLPKILSPEGAASADISLEPGGNFRGELSVTNARTHPLESIGPVRNIQLLARLDGRQLRLEKASGEVGGQRVNIDGSVELTEQLWHTNATPHFQVHLSGTNVPLARNPSVLLRADLDLGVTNSSTEIPIVYGKVKLRDSLFLADLQALVPQHTASARQRPPYFSIEAEPWAHWKLKVNVQGDGFLRVQTPLFHAKVSTVMTLEGTLKDPLALGQVKIDPGSYVSFPFSSLDVKQGFVSLSSEDPYRPNLFISAEARRFGYDVKMEITGPADQPEVKFSSIPGLSSEEIVLMLTAGQIPRGLGVTASTQQRASGLAIFVGKNLLSDFGLGGGGEDRLTIRSGEEISEAGRQTYDIEYKLTDKWSVIGEYDRFDQYNLNIKYKIYSK